MEKLEQSQRELIMKMSSDRLRMKLAKAGLDEQQIAAMSREQLLETWANVVLKEMEQPSSGAARLGSGVGYDVELERRRLEFEIRRYEEGKIRRKEEIEREEARWREKTEC